MSKEKDTDDSIQQAVAPPAACSLLLQGIESLIAEWTDLAIEYDAHVIRHERSGNLVAANVAEGRRKTWKACADDLRRLIEGQKEGNDQTLPQP